MFLYYLYLVFAVVGGTVFIVQFVMQMSGFAADDLDLIDDVPDDLPEDFGDVGDPQGTVVDHGSTWLFSIISFRSIIAAMTFFGLAGVASLQANLHEFLSLVIALVAGFLAMYGVHFLMQSLHRLRHDGTVRVGRAVGQRGSVYLPIPPNDSGTGKVQLQIQGRIMEYNAVTSGNAQLSTGTAVAVTEVISPTTLRVEAVTKPASTEETADA